MVQVDLAQVWVVPEDGRSHALQPVSAQVHCVPRARLFRLVREKQLPTLTVLLDITPLADR